MIFLLFDGYAGGHLNKTPGGSEILWRGRAADPTVERGHKMCLTCPLTDPPHGKEVHHHHPPTTGVLRRGKWHHPARGGYPTSACLRQTPNCSIAVWSTPEERDLNCWIFPGHLVVNPCVLGTKVTWSRADKSEQSLSWGSKYRRLWNSGLVWATLLHGETWALFLPWGRNVSNKRQLLWKWWNQEGRNSRPPERKAMPASLQETLAQEKNRWSLAGPWRHTGTVFSM